ncbi:hypothetical protein SCATT_35780 [Streptantibioticus cattleyicolor NRRL 8057 = DSM 46488]|uniref:Uncharacterized protein n=1 Tax=Streptantibioticus cattleyicolor (strain ATCC 35852 / DSM 46488 / JCM 4925 / NBRC 14057 / NRRL 8057) TaxID=1003195 RepID=G8WX45_STREN|nr:hypothetical protein SCATT_35780 [Streptantibioticus cattleyicolor NRRL 8057 = DSM 46488]
MPVVRTPGGRPTRAVPVARGRRGHPSAQRACPGPLPGGATRARPRPHPQAEPSPVGEAGDRANRGWGHRGDRGLGGGRVWGRGVDVTGSGAGEGATSVLDARPPTPCGPPARGARQRRRPCRGATPPRGSDATGPSRWSPGKKVRWNRRPPKHRCRSRSPRHPPSACPPRRWPRSARHAR